MGNQERLQIEGSTNETMDAFHKEHRSRGTTPRSIELFQKVIYDHFHASGRTFPWRETTDPYAILVSEIMLQQTQTERVVPKYLDFLLAFPDFEGLASASLKDVLGHWQGLGYNRRGKALWDMAQMVVEKFDGVLPNSYDELLSFPGIGPYTAGAVCAFAFNQPVVFMDTNIRRVYIHFFFPDREGVKDSEIVPLLELSLDCDAPGKWYSALMDYGAILKSGWGVKGGGGKGGPKGASKKETNPNRRSAHYTKQSPFEGSDRQIRGAILKELLNVGGSGGEMGAKGEKVEGTEEIVEGIEEKDLITALGKKKEEAGRVGYILHQMEGEGLVRENKGRWMIPED